MENSSYFESLEAAKERYVEKEKVLIDTAHSCSLALATASVVSLPDTKWSPHILEYFDGTHAVLALNRGFISSF